MDVPKLQRMAVDGCFFMTGSLLFAISVNCFTAPNSIAPGGVTGASILLDALTGVPIGLTNLLLNLPLFLWGARVLGLRGIAKSACVVVLSSVLIDAGALFLPHYQGDSLLASIYGGVFAGAGLGLIFLRGGTTGGTDLAALLLTRRWRRLSLGRLILMIDLPIVLAAIPVYRSVESPMYAMVVIFITTHIIDFMLYGSSTGTGKLLFIVSRESEQIQREILNTLRRGTTVLYARGGWSHEDGEVLLAAVSRPEVSRARELVFQIDPGAFLIVTDAGEITGEGFASMQ